MTPSDPPGPAPIHGQTHYKPSSRPPPRTSRPPPRGRGSLASIPGRGSLASIPDRPSRLSIYYQQLFKPRWKPWSPARVAATALAFGSVMTLLVIVSPKLVSMAKVRIFHGAVVPTVTDTGIEPYAAPPAEGDRADASLARKGRSPLAGGLLTLPKAFASADGSYDLVIHFHGNTDLVEESFDRLPLSAVVVILNLGNGSGPYEDRFANALALPEILGRVQTTMEKRGLRSPKLRRLALSAWSAGYGAVLRVLEQPALADQVDAVLLFDGIHCGYLPKSTDLQIERIAPFVRFAREAAEGRKLFSITHSEITPIGNYAGTHRTTDALLEQVGVARGAGGEAPAVPALGSIEGVIPRKIIKPLVEESEAAQGGLRVRGYAGDQPEHHTMQLVEMSVTALPDLVARWGSPSGT
jgi:hypothetical protein